MPIEPRYPRHCGSQPRLRGRHRLYQREVEEPGQRGALRARRRRCTRSHRLDQSPTLERWQRRDVWRQLRWLHAVGCGQALASGTENDRAVLPERSGIRAADEQQCVSDSQLRLGVLRDQQQAAGQPDLLRREALAEPSLELVSQRQTVSRDRPGRWHSQSMAAAMAESSCLRQLLAEHDGERQGLRGTRYPGTCHRWLLR